MSASAPARSIEFHNTTLGATIAVLQAAEPSTLADSLHKMLGGMPDFFSGELLILDFGGVAQLPERIDWSGLQSLLRRYRLQPIGVMRLAAEHHEGARRAGLALVDPAQLAARP
ncbi:MAG TPA: septum site-determining protein MinC, partial [Thauera aminoaromatica]|nr:septum site-determining protein MinC [Thauera aminoaromatica]